MRARIRDERMLAKRCSGKEPVVSIMMTFGGLDIGLLGGAESCGLGGVLRDVIRMLERRLRESWMVLVPVIGDGGTNGGTE